MIPQTNIQRHLMSESKIIIINSKLIKLVVSYQATIPIKDTQATLLRIDRSESCFTSPAPSPRSDPMTSQPARYSSPEALVQFPPQTRSSSPETQPIQIKQEQLPSHQILPIPIPSNTSQQTSLQTRQCLGPPFRRWMRDLISSSLERISV